ncbi:monovalent cation:proton antiporter family protein [Staphylococcus saprophyticus]|jgi:CPA2 family monovalent cation:H+ antiporter-2|uniref:monovalent cation:proton antiporter family protein n=1 Tax=Staphylococcus saprophyticus TaxID=29385 RepID=UPI001403E9EC|nr:monovalent cation:proton antiporter family protein [Staphylococcus saprophyticus]MBC2921674.1 monovalent cation:proton antiporter family protein [Staphylococcus saprophyticus]MBC2957615.1 monovalent cation:proton antiporter family protein [Staphylococcus saprophyticus]MBC3009712.1 monovalent cation:proton antiporter family protein [Staphylococcus saprophyticus]MBC3023993.1 monovalent cation:proton antiporter family protein [Staphylococcus saprophyticus]MBC3031000.1 monovalent cation:proton 
MEFLSLVVVVLAAFFTPILVNRLRITFLPIVVAEILMGIVIGHSFLNLVERDAMLNILSTLGFIFLMFLSGLEIDFKAFKRDKSSANKEQKLKKQEPGHLQLAVVVFMFIMIISIIFAYMFKWFGLIDDVLLMVIIISTISLGVVVPTLKEMNIMRTTIGQFILLVAVLADLVTMILLTAYGTLHASGNTSLWLIGSLVVFTIIFYLLGGIFKKAQFLQKLMDGTTQIGIRAVFALIILLVALAEGVGAENILGAFLAGVVVSLLGPDEDMVEKLDSFGYGFFIPIFFIMVGVDLNIPQLIKEPALLLIIPFLILAFLISKLIPLFYIRKWFDMKTTISSAFLLTSTLSLVIASAKIAEQLGTISPEISGILILSAVITCVFVPIVFKKMFPMPDEATRQIEVSLIGKNQLTIPIAQNLSSQLYQVSLYYRNDLSDKRKLSDAISMIEISDYEEELLERLGLFERNIVVCSTNDDEINRKVALMAKAHGVKRVICRLESSSSDETLQKAGIEIFSSYMSNKILLKGLIETPNMLNLLSNVETSLYEIAMLNHQYDQIQLRNFPFGGDIIFVRIIRNNESIVPHGDTQLRYRDRVIVTGSKEYVEELKRELEFYY